MGGSSKQSMFSVRIGVLTAQKYPTFMPASFTYGVSNLALIWTSPAFHITCSAATQPWAGMSCTNLFSILLGGLLIMATMKSSFALGRSIKSLASSLVLIGPWKNSNASCIPAKRVGGSFAGRSSKEIIMSLNRIVWGRRRRRQ